MDFAPSPRAEEMHDRLKAFMEAHIYPRIRDHKEEIEAGNFPVTFMEDLKSLARAEGLWNMFLPSFGMMSPVRGSETLITRPWQK